MENENTNERRDSDNPSTKKAGANGRGSGPKTGSESTGDISMETKTTREGAQSGQPTSNGTKGSGSLDWRFAEPWNEALDEEIGRATEARSNIWASELGKAPIDVYLRMKGTEPTNPPNARSRRKFEAGNMFEWIVGLILKRAGILHSGQDRIVYQYPGMCEVTGRSDYTAGGKPDFDKAKAELESLELPPMFYRGFERVIEHLQTKYPDGLGLKPLEIKSLSSFMFEAIEKTGQALRSHRLQLTHYLKGTGYTVGHVVYICRDDMRMMEIPVALTPAVEADYKQEIEKLSGFFNRDELPPLEKPIVWDMDLHKFVKNNMGMAYSLYLTKLYKIKDQAEFDAKYQPMQMRFNRVLKRLAKGDKITDKNLDVLNEMTELGFVPAELAKLVPLDAPEEDETATE